MVLLLETIALNHRLKKMGYHSAKEFNAKLLAAIKKMNQETLIKKIRVKNELGLHTRPATIIVKLLQDCKSNVWFTHKNETIDAKSILNILMLAVQKNALLTIEVSVKMQNRRWNVW